MGHVRREQQSRRRSGRGPLRERLMKDRQLRLNETFAAYASATLPDSAWDGGWRHWTYELWMPEGVFVGNWEPEIPIDELLPRDRAVLKASLRRSYRARSGFVHAGDRMGDGTNELLLVHPAPEADQRVSFAALRYLLRSLIDDEIRTRSAGDGVVPNLMMTLEEPTSAPRHESRHGQRRGPGRGRRTASGAGPEVLCSSTVAASSCPPAVRQGAPPCRSIQGTGSAPATCSPARPGQSTCVSAVLLSDRRVTNLGRATPQDAVAQRRACCPCRGRDRTRWRRPAGRRSALRGRSSAT